jgi:hypothetical protein
MGVNRRVSFSAENSYIPTGWPGGVVSILNELADSRKTVLCILNWGFRNYCYKYGKYQPAFILRLYILYRHVFDVRVTSNDYPFESLRLRITILFYFLQKGLKRRLYEYCQEVEFDVQKLVLSS